MTSKEIFEKIKHHKKEIEFLNRQLKLVSVKETVGFYFITKEWLVDTKTHNLVYDYNVDDDCFSIISITENKEGNGFKLIYKTYSAGDDLRREIAGSVGEIQQMSSSIRDQIFSSLDSFLSQARNTVQTYSGDLNLSRSQNRFIGKCYKILDRPGKLILVFDYSDESKKAKALEVVPGDYMRIKNNVEIHRKVLIDDEEVEEVTESDFLNEYNSIASKFKEAINKTIKNDR